MNAKIRVLVVDDHTVVRKGLVSLLSAEKYGVQVVGEAANGEEAVAMAHTLRPDVILMDLIMPVMDGVAAIREIRRENPAARILVLTSYPEDDKVIEAVRQGAMGYLLKDVSPEDLVQSIQSVALDRLSLPPDFLVKLVQAGSKPGGEQGGDELTERERDVLKCIAQGFSNKQIAKRLSVSPTTVRTHVSNLLRKLEMENRTQLAIYARDQGLS